MKKTILISAAIFAYCVLQTANCFPQGTSINSTGAKADSSAMLDVSSTTTGLLTPRMTTSERNAINNPANGLLIYNLDCPGFNFFNGSFWYPFAFVPTLSTPGAVSGSASVCEYDAGVPYSIAPVTGATNYFWIPPPGATVASGQGTDAVTVDFGTTSGSLYIIAVNNCQISASNSIAITVIPVPAAPVATSATNIQSNQFSANWNTVPGAASYYLDVATDMGFTSFVSGYNNLDVGLVLTYSVTGLSCNSGYYYRVRAYSGCTSASSNTITATTSICCTNQWTQKADMPTCGRTFASGFTIGDTVYIGPGQTYSCGGNVSKDFWKWDPSTNSWTQKADYGGGNRYLSAGMSIGSKGYFIAGRDGTGTFKKDMWEYDPATNIWTQKADFGGGFRCCHVAFSIGTFGYVATGANSSWVDQKDLWEYNSTNDTWTQKTDFPGVARESAVGFSVGTKGYLGTGSNGTKQKDFYEYNPSNDTWTQKTDFGGSARVYAVGFSVGAKGYIGTGYATGYLSDLWEYNPVTDGWTQKASMSTSRNCAVGVGTATKGYIGTGETSPTYKDLWEYCP